MDKEVIKKIAGIVSDLKYYEWLKVVHAIEKKYSSAFNKLELDDTEELIKAIDHEFT